MARTQRKLQGSLRTKIKAKTKIGKQKAKGEGGQPAGKYMKGAEGGKERVKTLHVSKKAKTGARAKKQKRMGKLRAEAAKAKKGASGGAAGDASMDADEGSVAEPQLSPKELVEAGGKLADYLENARRGGKAETAIWRALRTAIPSVEVMSNALAQCAARGLVPGVRLLIQANAPPTARDDSEPEGRRTALQAAACRGHVTTCRLLVEYGFDRSGALDAAKTLESQGEMFAEEHQALLKLLK